MSGRHQFGLNPRRQRVRSEVDDARQFLQFDTLHTVANIHDGIADNIEFVRHRLQDSRRDL